MKPVRTRSFLVLAFVLLLAAPASAEVTILKTDNWEFFTTGRVNGFVVHGWGDANPQALNPGETIIPGGGLDVGSDSIAGPTDPNTGMPTQGTFNSWRIRNGFVPNVFSFGLRTQVSENLKLLTYLGLWTSIGTLQQRKTGTSWPDAREGFLKLEGPWGSLLVGRALDLFSRGATENDFLYGHGYGVGYPGNIDNVGNTNGLIGFGVLAAFFQPGVVYATPVKGGLQLSIGAYDPATIPGIYEATRYPLGESELTFDYAGPGTFRLHLFGNTAFQKLYQPSISDGVSAWGFGYGLRLEAGFFHLGLAGHYGKGLGLYYAFQADATSFSQDKEARTFDGYSGFAQFVLGQLDLNLGAGISRVFLLPSDETNTAISLTKRQIGYSIVGVWHWTPHLHTSLEYMRGDFAWFLGEKQIVNFVSAGITATW